MLAAATKRVAVVHSIMARVSGCSLPVGPRSSLPRISGSGKSRFKSIPLLQINLLQNLQANSPSESSCSFLQVVRALGKFPSHVAATAGTICAYRRHHTAELALCVEDLDFIRQSGFLCTADQLNQHNTLHATSVTCADPASACKIIISIAVCHVLFHKIGTCSP